MLITKPIIQDYIDNIVVGNEQIKQADVLGILMESLIPYMLKSYRECREITQFAIGQLMRIPKESAIYFFLRISNLIESLPIGDVPTEYLDYIRNDWDDNTVREMLDKVPSSCTGSQFVFALHPEVAEALTKDERRSVASFVLDYVQTYGTQTTWDNDIILNVSFLCNILYSICKKDNILNLLFPVSGVIIDRLNTSNNCQIARDFAESVLIVGYNEGFLAEAYFTACRAYTGANNAVAGLFFYYISLTEIVNKGKPINTKFAIDIYWQYVKICRAVGIYPKADIEKVIHQFEKLKTSLYDKLYFHHTIFSAQLKAGINIEDLPNRVAAFLDQNREGFYQNLEIGSMPWITLILSMQDVVPNCNYSGLMFYVNAAKQVASKEGNELIFDLFEDKNLRKHLKVVQYKLQDTRDRSDYSMDNTIAMVIAKKLLQQSYDNKNVTDYLIAMSPKTDLSTVMPINEVHNLYRRLDIRSADGDELSIIYQWPEKVIDLLQVEDDDVVYWIGRGKVDFLAMILQRGQFSMAGSITVTRHELISTVQKYVLTLKYERDIKEPGRPIYIKSDTELEEEDELLKEKLLDFSIFVPKKIGRLLFIKDLEIADYPHNLLIQENENNFIGSLCPCCNVLSTEVFVKTNMSNSLSRDFTKAFWIPYDNGEFTFDIIYGNVEDVIKAHNVSIQQNIKVDSPISADLTILCAHGASNISSTNVFYVNDKPILDALHCIGAGKIAVMFICYSGSISKSLYDNAMHTMVKKLIQKGYSSVVAPMWSLPTETISPWLGIFLESLESGEYIIDAVFKANMKLKEDFIATSAWACLHLFGNPYTRISDEPRLIVNLNQGK